MVKGVSISMNIQDSNINGEQVEELIGEAIRSNATEPVYSRPSRASKTRALSQIRSIHEWENCSERSKLFKDAETVINAEFDALHPEERVITDDESEYSEESDDEEDDNLSFVDKDSDIVDDAASWSAAESEPESETESDDDEDESSNDEESLMEIFADVQTPTRGVEDMTSSNFDAFTENPKKRKRFVDSDSE
tara:strand:- start:17121 stop:17702 length:582 start_codon:yes stop_codon:yes gene_type:complete